MWSLTLRVGEERSTDACSQTACAEQEAEECLHCAIFSSTMSMIAAGGADAASLAALIAESLVDVILRVPEEEQARLMAHTLTALGDFFLQKSGAEAGGSASTH